MLHAVSRHLRLGGKQTQALHLQPMVALASLRLVEKVIQGRDFTCMTESVNAVEAWLGSLPGHAYANVRQPIVHTLNLVHLMPVSAVWAGPEGNAHLRAPPLMLGVGRHGLSSSLDGNSIGLQHDRCICNVSLRR